MEVFILNLFFRYFRNIIGTTPKRLNCISSSIDLNSNQLLTNTHYGMP